RPPPLPRSPSARPPPPVRCSRTPPARRNQRAGRRPPSQRASPRPRRASPGSNPYSSRGPRSFERDRPAQRRHGDQARGLVQHGASDEIVVNRFRVVEFALPERELRVGQLELAPEPFPVLRRGDLVAAPGLLDREALCLRPL